MMCSIVYHWSKTCLPDQPGVLRKWLLPVFFLALTLSQGLWQSSLQAQETARKNFQVSYDLRGCSDGFGAVWRYYRYLGNQEGGKVFSDADQLRNNASGLGRFAQRSDIPNLDFISSRLGSGKQIFAQLLWRDKGRDRAYIFTVQRNVDVYGNYYYPYLVYEDLQFPWNAWQNWSEAKGNGSSLGCQEDRLFARRYEEHETETPLLTDAREIEIDMEIDKALNQARAELDAIRLLQVQDLRIADPQWRLIGQEAEPIKQGEQGEFGEVDPLRAENTVLLNVDSAEQLCQWQLRYGKSVRVTGQQIAGSTAWRFRQQDALPYGLTRLQLYQWGAPQRPFPLAYTSYNNKNYILLVSFEKGYRLNYLPQAPRQSQPMIAKQVGDNRQVSGMVIFWLAPVQQIPEGLKPAQEDFQSTAYDLNADCSTNAYRRTGRKQNKTADQ